MNCSSAERLFEPYLDDALAPAARLELEGHLAQCAPCESVMTELRVVDGLLCQPRRVELGPNFTRSTMAEARALDAPCAARRAPLAAYLVAYLAAAWLMLGVTVLFAPQAVHAMATATFALLRALTEVFASLGGVIARLLSRGGNGLGTVLLALLALDLVVMAGAGFALTYLRPRVRERLRS